MVVHQVIWGGSAHAHVIVSPWICEVGGHMRRRPTERPRNRGKIRPMGAKQPPEQSATKILRERGLSKKATKLRSQSPCSVNAFLLLGLLSLQGIRCRKRHHCSAHGCIFQSANNDVAKWGLHPVHFLVNPSISGIGGLFAIYNGLFMAQSSHLQRTMMLHKSAIV